MAGGMIEMQILGSYPHLLDWDLWKWGQQICADSDTHYSLRNAALENKDNNISVSGW